jgi:hypothetical protein
LVRFYVSHPKLKQEVLEELVLFRSAVTLCFILKEFEQIDIVSGHFQIPAWFIHGLHGRLGNREKKGGQIEFRKHASDLSNIQEALKRIEPKRKKPIPIIFFRALHPFEARHEGMKAILESDLGNPFFTDTLERRLQSGIGRHLNQTAAEKNLNLLLVLRPNLELDHGGWIDPKSRLELPGTRLIPKPVQPLIQGIIHVLRSQISDEFRESARHDHKQIRAGKKDPR